LTQVAIRHARCSTALSTRTSTQHRMPLRCTACACGVGSLVPSVRARGWTLRTQRRCGCGYHCLRATSHLECTSISRVDIQRFSACQHDVRSARSKLRSGTIRAAGRLSDVAPARTFAGRALSERARPSSSTAHPSRVLAAASHFQMLPSPVLARPAAPPSHRCFTWRWHPCCGRRW